MKLLALVCLFATFTVMADTWVNGYQRRDGTYVQGHYKTKSNNTLNDNYSTRGNTNPYTGSSGYKTRDYDSGYGSNYGTGSKRRSKSGW